MSHDNLAALIQGEEEQLRKLISSRDDLATRIEAKEEQLRRLRNKIDTTKQA